MHYKPLVIAIFCLGFVLPLQAADDSTELKTDQDKLSYVIGSQIGTSLKRQDINPNLDVLFQAIRDVFAGKAERFSLAEQQQIIHQFQAAQQAKQQAKEAKTLGANEWKTQLKKPEMMTFDKNTDYFWVLDTNKGTIKIKLMPDVAPMHVTSTIFLTKKGFYDGLTFHRIIKGFMAQGGDPLGTGTGGPGYQYAGEIDPKVTFDKPYLLAMANAGPGTDGSQFFITFKPTTWLNGKHTIFGSVVEGTDVVDKMEAVDTDSRDKPKEPVIIKKATIEEKAK